MSLEYSRFELFPLHSLGIKSPAFVSRDVVSDAVECVLVGRVGSNLKTIGFFEASGVALFRWELIDRARQATVPTSSKKWHSEPTLVFANIPLSLEAKLAGQVWVALGASTSRVSIFREIWILTPHY